MEIYLDSLFLLSIRYRNFKETDNGTLLQYAYGHLPT